jgi:prepilin-type N-terminal cleavage/methylation domain-containing protein
MNKQPKSRSAFTLIEMLVVIVIMSLLAMAIVSALKSAQRQAQAAHCQARMKNLHQACMNYLADHSSYPYAGSSEGMEYKKVAGRKIPVYYEHKGWVAWVRVDGAMDGADKPFNPWAKDNTIPHAAEYLHAGMFDNRVFKSFKDEIASRSIREGSIFKYANLDTSAYVCDTAAKSFKRRYTKVVVRRTYAMNKWFCSRRGESAKKLLSFSEREPSRMAYIIEIQQVPDDVYGKEHSGTKKTPIPDDSAWEYDDKDNKTDDADDERYGLFHRKDGKMHGHVIFVDGHIESMTDQPDKQRDDYATQNKKLGIADH